MPHHELALVAAEHPVGRSSEHDTSCSASISVSVVKRLARIAGTNSVNAQDQDY
jgi:hypothetical protein